MHLEIKEKFGEKKKEEIVISSLYYKDKRMTKKIRIKLKKMILFEGNKSLALIIFLHNKSIYSGMNYRGRIKSDKSRVDNKDIYVYSWSRKSREFESRIVGLLGTGDWGSERKSEVKWRSGGFG